MLARARAQWGGQRDLWVFGYGSLLWKPELDFVERRAAQVFGWHRALKMWSRVNRGTPECPGLVFGLLSGGSCRGMVFRLPREDCEQGFVTLWQREMVTGVYDPRWLPCRTDQGTVQALAFTLSKQSPQHTGSLDDQEYRRIFSTAAGRFGTTRDYARKTYEELRRLGIEDRALARLLRLSQADSDGGGASA
ncbi:gamma-glutamylcyclotransferase [Xylophilus rhododendri]|uniref:glutathione-specific gamma-glutamylcyclotransferase n=2 Tax=Xylophilus rhododendri TaxID=2697032 RepID=A0A857JF23_9BURK|nr:gamma-glutamylcyclotransferase [Xylophilus rhododendri]